MLEIVLSKLLKSVFIIQNKRYNSDPIIWRETVQKRWSFERDNSAFVTILLLSLFFVFLHILLCPLFFFTYLHFYLFCNLRLNTLNLITFFARNSSFRLMATLKQCGGNFAVSAPQISPPLMDARLVSELGFYTIVPQYI